MLTLISPAKNLDFDTPVPVKKHSKAGFLEQSQALMNDLKQLAPHDVSALMGISDKLGTLNYDRFQSWQLPFTKANARQAMYAFKGDVYVGLDAYGFSDEDAAFAQDHLRILSGLYGLLRPLDLIQPYRLEMGTKFGNAKGKNLYAFWGDELAQAISSQLRKSGSTALVNLASNEYFKAAKTAQLEADVITPVFKDNKNGQYKIISFFAKKARGRMSAYIVKNRITDPERLKSFDWDGYAYDASLSSEREWVFTRDQQ